MPLINLSFLCQSLSIKEEMPSLCNVCQDSYKWPEVPGKQRGGMIGIPSERGLLFLCTLREWFPQVGEFVKALWIVYINSAFCDSEKG